jgi:hypothetical protein
MMMKLGRMSKAFIKKEEIWKDIQRSGETKKPQYSETT